MIYYGTEAGMWGADDPDDRMPMVWPELTYDDATHDPLQRARRRDAVGFDHSLFDFYQDAIRLRKQSVALRRGRFQVVATNDTAQTLAFVRQTETDWVLVAVYLLSWITAVIYSRMIARMAQRVMQEMREQLARRLQTLSIRFFDRRRTGDLMSRVTNDVDAIDQLLSQNLLTIFWASVQIVSLLTIMLVLDWRLTFAVLIPVPVSMFIVRKLGQLSGPRFGAYQRSIGVLNATAEERLSGQRTVIALDRQDRTEHEFAEVNERTRSEGIRAQSLTAVMMPLMFGLGNLSTV